jgi:glutamyl-tRNA(Gln) amidotransferase subunit E
LGVEPDHSDIRFLRLSSSELGETDAAALLEARKSRKFEYKYSTANSCLVELDEAPPHLVNEDALRIVLKVALMFNMKVLDEIRVMRKVVLDGSNTSGFQRTMLVAVGTDESKVRTSTGDVRINTLCLEEESAFIVSTEEREAVYRLDRLGIPLIELATAPDIHSADQVREIAEEVGLRVRLTGDMQRGIGSIRQDINVSIKGGSRQEIKGVQELKLVGTMVDLEAKRQVALLKIRDELNKRKISPLEFKCVDVTDSLKGSKSSLVQGALKKKHSVLCLPAPGFEGLLGTEVSPGRRFGRELAERARAWAGVGGIVHSDELPGYGISKAEIEAVRKACGLRSAGAFVIVLADEETARRALEAVHKRLVEATVGVPSETRRANEDGTTSYLRPLPGAARMYPETDLPPIVIRAGTLEKLRKSLPPTPSQKKDQLMGLGLSEQVALQLVRSPRIEAFESAVSAGATPTTAATAILTIVPTLRREGIDVDSVEDVIYINGIAEFSRANLPKESLDPFIRELVASGSVQEAIDTIKAPTVGEAEARAIIREIISEKAEFVKQKGKESVKPLMGLVMEKLRGKLPGTVIHRLLEEEVEAML